MHAPWAIDALSHDRLLQAVADGAANRAMRRDSTARACGSPVSSASSDAARY